jgi:hypothetical protein
VDLEVRGILKWSRVRKRWPLSWVLISSFCMSKRCDYYLYSFRE